MSEEIDPRLLEIARRVIEDDKAFSSAFPTKRQLLNEKYAEVAQLQVALAAMTTERDALKEQLQRIGRKAFWASKT